MISPTRSFPACLLLASLLAGGPADAWDPDLRRLLPRDILVGPEVGMLESRFSASPEYRSLIQPTAAGREFWTFPTWGLSATARWSHWFSLTVSPRRETYGMETREETVAFPGNPFPHELRARTEIAYNVWPIVAGMGLEGRRQHLRVQLGFYRAFYHEGDVQWIVDGEESGREPSVQFQEDFTGWSVGVDYGFRMGPGEWILGAEMQRGLETMMSGLEGSIKAQSSRIRMGYQWTVFRKDSQAKSAAGRPDSGTPSAGP